MARRSLFAVMMIILIASGTIFSAYAIETGMFSSNQEQPSRNASAVIDISIEVVPQQETDYIIYLPIPIIANLSGVTNISKIVYEIDAVTGNPEFQVVSVDKGFALEIKADCHIRLSAHKEFYSSDDSQLSEYGFSELSMKIPPAHGQDFPIDAPRFIFLNSTTPVNISYNVYSEVFNNGRTGSGGYSKSEWGVEDYHLAIGWQEVDLYISILFVD